MKEYQTPTGGQSGPKGDSTQRSSSPLDDLEAFNQGRMRFPKDYKINDRRLPDVTVEVNAGNQMFKEGSFPSDRPLGFRGKPFDESYGLDENVALQWKKPNEFDSPGAFGHGA